MHKRVLSDPQGGAALQRFPDLSIGLAGFKGGRFVAGEDREGTSGIRL